MDYSQLSLHGVQIGAAVKFNVNNLQTMQEAGGFRRITQLMQWTAFTFHPTELGASSSKPNTAAASHSPRPHAFSSPRLGLKSLTIRSKHTQLTPGLLHTPLLCVRSQPYSSMTEVVTLWCKAMLWYMAYVQRVLVGCIAVEHTGLPSIVCKQTSPVNESIA